MSMVTNQNAKIFNIIKQFLLEIIYSYFFNSQIAAGGLSSKATVRIHCAVGPEIVMGLLHTVHIGGRCKLPWLDEWQCGGGHPSVVVNTERSEGRTHRFGAGPFRVGWTNRLELCVDGRNFWSKIKGRVTLIGLGPDRPADVVPLQHYICAKI